MGRVEGKEGKRRGGEGEGGRKGYQSAVAVNAEEEWSVHHNLLRSPRIYVCRWLAIMVMDSHKQISVWHLFLGISTYIPLRRGSMTPTTEHKCTAPIVHRCATKTGDLLHLVLSIPYICVWE